MAQGLVTAGVHMAARMLSAMSNPPSLLSRLLVTVIIGLLAIVGVHLLLSAWLERSIHSAERQRLLGWSTAYAQALSTPGVQGAQGLSDLPPPDVRFGQDGSPVWAALISDGQVIWTSESAPAQARRAPLQGFDFQKEKGVFEQTGRGTFAFSEDPKTPHRLVLPVFGDSATLTQDLAASRAMLVVAESSVESLDRKALLKSTLWWGMLLSLLAILASQAVAARWTASPLRQLERNLAEVRSGQESRLGRGYPREVEGVVVGFNELLDRETRQLISNRHAMDNLAHSLKTPLAVLRSVAETEPDPQRLRHTIVEQVARMDKQVAYHLSVAGRQGRAWSPPSKSIAIEPVAQGLAQGLEKLYAHKGALCEFEGLEGAVFAMEEGDLQEMLGNLMDNAFKWCEHRVLLSVSVSPRFLVLEVGDDGPGVPKDRMEDIKKRGRRADERLPGHGIGLAAVEDIVTLYGGRLDVSRHEELGGASFKIALPVAQAG